MKTKILLISLVAISLSSLLFAQQDDRLIYQDKQTIYSKIDGQEGRNINLTLLVYDNTKIKLLINYYTDTIEHKDTVFVHELNYLPLQNLIINTLQKRGLGTRNQPVSEILESQSLSTINMLVLKAQTFLTSLNNIDRNDITSTFSFKIKIPIYIDADTAYIQKLFKLVGYKEVIIPNDSMLQFINDSIRNLNIKLSSLNNTASTMAKINEEKVIKSTLIDLNESKQIYQSMIDNKKKNKFLVGFAFVSKNELVINNSGYAKTMRMTLSDSMELRYRFGGNKIPLTRFGIKKIQDYNFSLDLRSISASQRSLDKYIAIWKYLPKSASELDFWTHLTEIVQYDPPDDEDITELFVPQKQRIIFDVENPLITTVKETDINNVVKLNIFTDLVGIQEDQPNGLIQAEGTFMTHLFGIGLQRKYRKNNTYLFDHLEANLKFSKIDNKLRYLNAGTINGGSEVTFIPNFQLLQYSNLETGIKVSTIKVESYKSEFNLYGSLGIIRTGIRDTTYSVNVNKDTTKIPRTYNVLSFEKSIQAHFRMKATSYMGLDVSTEFIWLTLLDSDIKQSGGDFSREGNVYEEFDPKINVLIKPQFQVYYMPNKDESQRLYLRAAFVHDLGTKSNNYLTIQVGLSSDINKFLNFNKTK